MAPQTLSKRVLRRFRRSSRLRIVGYRSYGDRSEVLFLGRVLDNRPVPRAKPGERSVTAVARMAERFLTREVSGVPVLVTLGTTSGAAITDSEGYFSVGLPVDDTVSVAGGRVGAQATIDGVGDDIWLIEGFVVGPDTSRIVISDVDDTLLLNGSGDVLKTVWNTAAGTALTRRPVPGTPELYRHLVAATDTRPKCPIFYVSSSPLEHL